LKRTPDEGLGNRGFNGRYPFAPVGQSYDEVVPAARRYLPGSLVLETTWQTRTGWLLVRDALCMGPWHNVDERSKTHRRSPTDFDAEHCLLRTVECVSGSVDVTMTAAAPSVSRQKSNSRSGSAMVRAAR
jgi:hypothetical protein